MTPEEKARAILDKDEQWKYFNILEDITAAFQTYESRIEKLRAALKFYANTGNYSFKDCNFLNGYGRPVLPEDDCSPIPADEFCSYGGKRARQALDADSNE